VKRCPPDRLLQRRSPGSRTGRVRHNRWSPVFERYLGQIAGRVQDLGGDPSQITPSPTGGGRRRPVVRKRVVLKVWPRDGWLTDNAHEVEWLERSGWRVVHSEKLLEDPRTGTCEILYLLERDKHSHADADYPPPAGGGVMQPLTVTVPAVLASDVQVVLSCSTTRGRILVRQLNPLSTASDAVIGPGPAPHWPGTAAGVVVVPMRTEGQAGPRTVGIFCINDADPYSPPVAPGRQLANVAAPPPYRAFGITNSPRSPDRASR
jgi:hypothetical protein